MKKSTVVASHPRAAVAGIEILERGGNAVDAAAATAFALAVVEPYNSGLGGAGGFISILVNGQVHSIDSNMVAPGRAKPDMYTLVEAEEGISSPHRFSKAVKDAANNVGYKAIGVPGTVAGLCLAQQEFGKLDLQTVMQPAIKYAQEGFEVTWYDSLISAIHLDLLCKFESTSEVYLKNRRPYKPRNLHPMPADRLVQADLATVLNAIAKEGPDVFYRGWIAHAITEEIEKNDGILSANDLAEYRPRLLKPGVCSYKDFEIFYFSENSGGPTVIEALSILEGLNLSSYGHSSPRSIHLIAESLAIAFGDRLRYLGDPAFVDAPLEKLVSKKYAAEQRRRISADKKLNLHPVTSNPPSDATTHLCTLDKDGNMVSLTQTLGSPFGSGVTIKGTGILMNNDMHWFNPEPGTPNSVAPRKKPLANMSPLVAVSKSCQLALGSSGGRRLISALVQVMLNITDHKMPVKKAIESPRIHREAEEIIIDARVSSSVLRSLGRIGHKVVPVDRTPASRDFGYPCAILRNKSGVESGIGRERQGVVLFS